MADTESNSGLYFIVGGLVVLAILGGFLMWPGDRVATTSSYNTVAPAAGTTDTQSDQTRVEFDGSGNPDSVTRTETETNQR